MPFSTTLPSNYETGRSRMIQRTGSFSLRAQIIYESQQFGDFWFTDTGRIEIHGGGLTGGALAAIIIRPYCARAQVGSNFVFSYGYEIGKRVPSGGGTAETFSAPRIISTLTVPVPTVNPPRVFVWAGTGFPSAIDDWETYVKKRFTAFNWTISGTFDLSVLAGEAWNGDGVWQEWDANGTLATAGGGAVLVVNGTTIPTSEYVAPLSAYLYGIDYSLQVTSSNAFGGAFPDGLGGSWFQRPRWHWLMDSLPTFAIGGLATFDLDWGTTPGADSPASVARTSAYLTGSWGDVAMGAPSWSGSAVPIPVGGSSTATTPPSGVSLPTQTPKTATVYFAHHHGGALAVSPDNRDIVSGASVAGDWAIDWGFDAALAPGANQNATGAKHALVSGTAPSATTLSYSGTRASYTEVGVGTFTVVDGNIWSAGGATNPDTYRHFNDVYVRLQTEDARSMATAGRSFPLCKARAYAPFDAISLTHAKTKDLEGGTATWPTGSGGWSGAGVSVALGLLIIAGGDATRRYTAPFTTLPPWEWHPFAEAAHEASRRLGYRFLRVRFKADEDDTPMDLVLRGIFIQPGAISTERRFRLTSGAPGDWVERVVDLLQRPPSPYNNGTLAGNYLTPPDHPYVWEMAFEGVPSGVTVEIDYVRGERQDVAALGSTMSVPSVAPSSFYLRGFSDGFDSLEQRWFRTPAGASFTRAMHSVTLGQLSAEIAGSGWAVQSGWYVLGGGVAPYADPWSGWGATMLCPRRSGKPTGTTMLPLSDAFDEDAPIHALGGDGILIEPGSPSPVVPTINLDIPVGDGTGSMLTTATRPWTIRAQRVAFRFRTYPGAGDVGLRGTAAGSYGSSTPVSVYAVVGGQAVGTVMDATLAESAESPTVSEARKDDGSGPVAVGPTARGTLAPVTGYRWHRGDTSLRGLTPNADAVPPLSRTYLNDLGIDGDLEITPDASVFPLHRERPYVRVWVSRVLHSLSLIHTASGQLCLASEGTAGDAGKIRFRRAEYAIPAGWTLDVWATTGTEDSQPALYRLPTGRLGLLFTRKGSSTNVYETFSDDDGETWSEPTMAFANASLPACEIDRATGKLLRLAICVDGSGYVLKATEQSPGDASPSAVFVPQRLDGTSLVDIRVERLGVAIRSAPHGSGTLVLSTVLEGDTDTTEMVSHDDGRTWS
jgi:hypothetical protein